MHNILRLGAESFHKNDHVHLEIHGFPGVTNLVTIEHMVIENIA